MLCCPKCGSINEKNRFCSSCGTPLNSEAVVEKKRWFSFPAKQTTTLINGIIIGGSLIAIFAALFMWNSLDASFWFDRNLITSQTTNAGNIQNIMLGYASSISLCGGVIALASSGFVIALLDQFIPAYRTTNRKNAILPRLANGALVGGLILLADYAHDNLYYYYANATTSYISGNYYNYFLFVGSALLLTSAGLLCASYLNSRKLATKFKDQNHSP